MRAMRRGHARFQAGVRVQKIYTLAVLAVCVIGCRAAADVEEIKTTQRQILERLAALEKNDRALLASLRSGQFSIESDPDRIHEIAFGSSPTKGPKDAPVTIVGFSDFQCPFSKSAVGLVDQILAAYPEEVRFVAKQFPLSLLHNDARNAARAALAARRQGKFWEMYDLLFGHQQALDYESLKAYAGTAGMDVVQFEKDMASAEIEVELAADVAEGRRANVTGTPTFFIDGRRLMTRSLEGFRVMIDEALSRTDSNV